MEVEMLLPVWQRVHPPTPVPEVVEAIQSYTSDTNKFSFPAHKNSEITTQRHFSVSLFTSS